METPPEHVHRVLEFAVFVCLFKYSFKFWILRIHFVFPVELACGATTTENCTYLVQASTATPTSPCQYTICRSEPDVCRIKLDLNVN